MGCIPCKAPISKATSHHTNVTVSLVPGECSHCGNDQTLYWCSQECSSTSQPRLNSSSDLRPAIIHSSKTDPVEVARHIWRRQTGGDVRGVAYWDDGTEDPGWLVAGSVWTQALVQAEITTAGTADSFLRAAHVTRTRRAHQVTAAALYIPQRRAYDQYSTTNAEDDEHPGSFEDWCSQR